MKKKATLNIVTNTKFTVGLSMKYDFSNQHYKSAVHFSECSYEIESSYNNDSYFKDKIEQKYLSFVTSSIILFVASLEASINEFFCDVIDKNPELSKIIDEKTYSDIVEIWNENERSSILGKYQKALTFLRVEEFKKGLSIYQNTDKLIKLRNILLHYKPEWDNELDNHKKIQECLKGKFASSPFYGKTSLWFPHQCLGYGCTKWAKEVVTSFMKEFCIKVNIPNKFY